MARGVFVAVMAAVAFLLVLAMVMIAGSGPVAMAQQAQPHQQAQPLAGQTQPATTQASHDRPGTAPPGTHGVPGVRPVLRRDQVEKRVSPEEREDMGLSEPDWTKQYGKVQPEVRRVLDTGQMPWLRFKGWEPHGFEGTAYVLVYLRDESRAGGTAPDKQTAIKETETRVLSRLTALEFRTVHTFSKAPALLGYVDLSGVAKLEADDDVLAVGLDDRPVPDAPPVPEEDLDTSDPSQAHVRAGRGAGPTAKVAPEVYIALERSNGAYVSVMVMMAPPAEWRTLPYQAKKVASQQIEDRVLRGVSAEDFRLRARGGLLGIAGCANSTGVAKLAQHGDVMAIVLSKRIKASD